MMKTTLVVPDWLRNEIASASENPLETAGVLLARCSELAGERRLLGQRIEWLDEPSYLERMSVSLSVASSGYVPALGLAEKLGAVAIWFHTHPGLKGAPVPSARDQVVDRQIADLFRLRTDSRFYGALIASPRNNGFAFTGHLEDETGERWPIGAVWSVGDRLSLTAAFNSRQENASTIFDRNVRAFGSAIQATLSALHVGIVGCGGTGSAVAEQLVRLGVRRFTLADPDVLSTSNVTRVFGSGVSDVDRPKVDVIGDNLERIADDVVLEKIQSMLTLEATAKRFAGCDVIFGCTDDNAGRLVLSRLSTYYLIPVFDCGMLLSSGADDVLSGIDGRVTTLVPGQACLVCRGRIDIRRAASELMTPDERNRLANEGYAPALGQVEPAVVAYTSMVASTAVSELLERLTGYGPSPRPSEVLLRAHEREISTNIALPRERHYCDPVAGKIGMGDRTPFLEQAWPT
jgi:hypothetical protein